MNDMKKLQKKFQKFMLELGLLLEKEFEGLTEEDQFLLAEKVALDLCIYPLCHITDESQEEYVETLALRVEESLEEYSEYKRSYEENLSKMN